MKCFLLFLLLSSFALNVNLKKIARLTNDNSESEQVEQVPTDSWVKIVNKSNHKCLYMNPGGQLLQNGCDGKTENFLWRFKKTPEGLFILRSKVGKFVIEVKNKNHNNSTPLVCVEKNENSNYQKFEILNNYNAKGYIGFRNSATQKCLNSNRPADGLGQDQFDCNSTNLQAFTITRVSPYYHSIKAPLSNQFVQIISRSTGQCLKQIGVPHKLKQENCNVGDTNQFWRFIKNNEDGTYHIVSKSGISFESNGNLPNNGNVFTTFPGNAQKNSQKFKLVNIQPYVNYMSIINKVTGKCLDSNNSFQDRRLQQWDCVNNNNQSFTFKVVGIYVPIVPVTPVVKPVKSKPTSNVQTPVVKPVNPKPAANVQTPAVKPVKPNSVAISQTPVVKPVDPKPATISQAPVVKPVKSEVSVLKPLVPVSKPLSPLYGSGTKPTGSSTPPNTKPAPIKPDSAKSNTNFGYPVPHHMPEESDWVQIVNRASQKCLKFVAEGVLVQFACNNHDSLLWQIKKTADDEGSYAIYSKKGNFVIDNQNGLSNNGNSIVAVTKNWNESQKWILTNSLSHLKHMTFVNKVSRKCIDVPNGNSSDNLRLQQYTCVNNDNQSFYFVYPLEKN